MRERWKLPRGESETAVREALSRRSDLRDWTAPCTTTLPIATDRANLARRA
ncbi:hypothetical protein GXW77_03330 [Roseomonas alkaliterrae]|uniref:Uncharacterized protein n=1 Tax=Neoroseomonas alkaliterrae TaxID=1452450 RepID=A0A840Y1Y8_9PROT|nr:hypothetical protein [Neoroseomonas alkaliterrae]MBB5690387.1 hypothetical protein [Neoroseomonas alkaliterrae]MBR0675201.1 hypothetical protein [Neoroseomonas alkaliterrae]